MIKTPWAAGVLALALAMPPALALADGADEMALRAAVEQAAWPGDIVRAADQYLRAFPEGLAADAIQTQRQRAAEAWRLVSRNDLRLYRASFSPPDGKDATRRDLRLAGLGDREAVVRLAHASRPLDNGGSAQRYVGWLQYASLLGDEHASYELALHYRRTDQPLLAAQYESLAVALGYQPAPSLDNARK